MCVKAEHRKSPRVSSRYPENVEYGQRKKRQLPWSEGTRSYEADHTHDCVCTVYDTERQPTHERRGKGEREKKKYIYKMNRERLKLKFKVMGQRQRSLRGGC